MNGESRVEKQSEVIITNRKTLCRFIATEIAINNFGVQGESNRPPVGREADALTTTLSS